MSVIRVVVVLITGTTVMFTGFFLGMLAGYGASLLIGGGAFPELGFLGLLAALVAWNRLRRHAHWWWLDRMRRGGVEVTARIARAAERYAANPRGPDVRVVSLWLDWTDPRTGAARSTRRSYVFPADKGGRAKQLRGRYQAGRELPIWVRRHGAAVDVPVLPGWYDRW